MKIIKARLRDGVANFGDVSKTITGEEFQMNLENDLLVVVAKKTGEVVVFPPHNVVAMWPETKTQATQDERRGPGRPRKG